MTLRAFLLLCAGIALPLLWRASLLGPLYADAQFRDRVQTLVEGTAYRYGWLLSDVELVGVQWGELRLLHRSHIRGDDPVRCYVLNMQNASLQSCS